jgi:short chain dehydrogenase
MGRSEIRDPQGTGRATFVANSEDVSDWEVARRLVDHALSRFGRLDVLVNNAGILRDRMLVEMEEADWDAVIKVRLKGAFCADPSCGGSLACGAKTKRHRCRRAGGQYLLLLGALRQYWPIQLRCREGRDRSFDDHRGPRTRALWNHRQRDHAPSQTRMTEGIRERSAAEIASRHPRWVAPFIVWLASTQSHGVTGRVFEAGGGLLAALEGWHRGPSAAPISDPEQIGMVLRDLAGRARRNADMTGNDHD